MFVWIHIIVCPSLLWNMLGFFRQKQRSEKWGRLYYVDSVDKVDNALYQLHTENICVDKRWQRLTLSAFSENTVAMRWHLYYISSLLLKRYIIVYQRLYRWYYSVSTCQQMATPKCVYPVCNAIFFHRPILRKYRGCRPISPFVLMPTFWLYITLQH